ncbi:MAG: carboxypeptidase regulatory-like domain-containing protein, partial [Acidobacteriota bacterium]
MLKFFDFSTKFILVFLSVIFLLLLTVVPAFGQGSEGTITGFVRDETGGVIPGVEVTIKNLGTGATRTVITDDSGRFSAVALPIGTYEVSASQAGFKKQVETGLKLNVAQTLRVDLNLQLGEITESVTVTGGGQLLQTETSDMSDVIEGKQITDLAINGRNFVSLATLTTGVSNQTGDEINVGVTGGTGGVVINGLRGNYTNWLVDGAQNTDVGNQASLSTYPAVEAIGEFRVLTSNYSAEYGTAGGGVVATATRSGGQEFHGSLYEFHRNDDLDAAPFFAGYRDGKKIKEPLIRNNFGYTIGGPFYLPNYNQDKTKDFFFFSQEFKYRRAGSVINATTLSDAMRNGDFSQNPGGAAIAPLCNPASGKDANGDCIDPFVNNQIPTDLFDPNSVILANYAYPRENNVVAGNFRNYNFAPTLPQNFHQELVRWDHHFNENLILMARFNHDQVSDGNATTTWAGQAFPTIGTIVSSPGFNYIFKLTHVMSPTLVHEFDFNQVGNNLSLDPTGDYARPSNLNIPELFPENRLNRIPNIQPSGYGQIQLASWPWVNLNDVWTWDDKWTWTLGNHSLKLGGLWQWQRKNQEAFGNTQGAFSFDGRYSGNSFADFLLGYANSYNEQDTLRNGLYRYWQLEAFVQDDWKVSPNFTLNLGVRYFIIPHLYEKNNQVTAFNPADYDITKAPQLDPGSGAIIPGTGVNPNEIGALGVVQAGTDGVPHYLTKTDYKDFAPRLGMAWDMKGDGKVILRGGLGVGYYRTEGNDTYNFINNPPFAQNVTINNVTVSDPLHGTAGAQYPAGMSLFETEYNPPRIWQWSFGFQFDTSGFVKDSMTQISYVGSHTQDLPFNQNINTPLPYTADDGTAYDFNPLINTGDYSTNYFRPYRGFANIDKRTTGGVDGVGRSNYNSLQAMFNKRYSGGFKLQVAYTFSKAMNTLSQFDSNAQNAYNIGADYALADWDVTHSTSINYIWQVPIFQTQEGFVGHLLGGWEISGITLLQSGTPGSIGLSTSNNGLATRPDLGSAVEYPKTINEWFTVTATQPAAGYYGDAGRNLVRSPFVNRWDFSLFKNTRVVKQRTELLII